MTALWASLSIVILTLLLSPGKTQGHMTDTMLFKIIEKQAQRTVRDGWRRRGQAGPGPLGAALAGERPALRGVMRAAAALLPAIAAAATGVPSRRVPLAQQGARTPAVRRAPALSNQCSSLIMPVEASIL